MGSRRCLSLRPRSHQLIFSALREGHNANCFPIAAWGCVRAQGSNDLRIAAIVFAHACLVRERDWMSTKNLSKKMAALSLCER
jgi:hypothetical protein